LQFEEEIFIQIKKGFVIKTKIINNKTPKKIKRYAPKYLIEKDFENKGDEYILYKDFGLLDLFGINPEFYGHTYVHDSTLRALLRKEVLNSINLVTKKGYSKQIGFILNHPVLSRLYCVFYPFSQEEIFKNSKQLYWGGGFYSFYEEDIIYGSTISQDGLCYNSNISWKNEIFEIADFENNDYLGGYVNFEDFPLSIDKEIEFRKDVFHRCFTRDNKDIQPDYGSPYFINAMNYIENIDTALNSKYIISSFEDLQEIISNDLPSLCLSRNFYESVFAFLKKENIDFLNDVLFQKR
jgi:hypothetical protein